MNEVKSHEYTKHLATDKSTYLATASWPDTTIRTVDQFSTTSNVNEASSLPSTKGKTFAFKETSTTSKPPFTLFNAIRIKTKKQRKFYSEVVAMKTKGITRPKEETTTAVTSVGTKTRKPTVKENQSLITTTTASKSFRDKNDDITDKNFGASRQPMTQQELLKERIGTNSEEADEGRLLER